MSCRQNGTLGGAAASCPADQGLNVFALVIYIPDPMGHFLDDLRRELVPQYKPRAHVSVLPPRPLAVDWAVASGQLRGLMGMWQPFDIELTRVAIFPTTHVIYLELGEGAEQLRQMHAAMAEHCLAFDEPFRYHPHVTLAQAIPASEVEELCRQAQRRWQGYAGPRRFRADRAVFVQSTLGNTWIDLAEYSLGMAVVR
jgi:2'-5' RNA ligase superfamily